MRCVSILIFSVLFARTAVAGERAGVTMADTITVEDGPLTLNGMGVRKATIFRVKVYVAGLYLERRSRSAADIIRSEQTKRLDVVLLRDVDRDDAVDAWREGLKKNGADMAKLKTRFDQLAGWISNLSEHDTLSFLYVPGSGVTMFVKGQRKGTIAGADFASALFSIWLGPDPADEALKGDLLGN
jgi:aromatic ring-cleaving dioxygenase